MNNRFRFDAPSVADEEELDDQLVAYNLRKVPCRQGEPFVKFCRCAYNEKMNWSAVYWHAVSSGTYCRLSLYGWRRITGDRALLPDC